MEKDEYVYLPTLTKEDYDLLQTNKKETRNYFGFVRKNIMDLTDTEIALLHLVESKIKSN
ncbi:hypothetical protein 12VC501_gene0040 [Vibrio phage 12VC501]|nr:hypothetical protein 12VC501_gene0040 [Vibrio phage 12VC501]